MSYVRICNFALCTQAFPQMWFHLDQELKAKHIYDKCAKRQYLLIAKRQYLLIFTNKQILPFRFAQQYKYFCCYNKKHHDVAKEELH